MPRPQYILCSDVVIQDKESGLVTFCNLVEQVTFTIQDLPRIESGSAEVAEPPEQLKLFVSAVWMKSAGDEDLRFVHEFAMTKLGDPSSPSDARAFVTSEFGFSKEKWLHRFTIGVQGPPPPIPGMIKFQSRVRKLDSDDPWITQEYWIPTEVVKIPPPDVQ